MSLNVVDLHVIFCNGFPFGIFRGFFSTNVLVLHVCLCYKPAGCGVMFCFLCCVKLEGVTWLIKCFSSYIVHIDVCAGILLLHLARVASCVFNDTGNCTLL